MFLHLWLEEQPALGGPWASLRDAKVFLRAVLRLPTALMGCQFEEAETSVGRRFMGSSQASRCLAMADATSFQSEHLIESPIANLVEAAAPAPAKRGSHKPRAAQI